MADVAELPESLHSLSYEDSSVDSEAQLVVSDFLDYTEYLPSDIIRSFTLIRQLDKTYLDAAAKVHELTKQYGRLPEIPLAERPDARKIRRDISIALSKALNCRQASAAEANRINEVVKRHQVRLGVIKTKLEALPKPPSRDSTPAPVSAELAKTSKDGQSIKLTVQEKRRKRKGLVLEDLPSSSVDQNDWNDYEDGGGISPMDARSELKARSVRTPKTPKTPRTRMPKTPKERRTGPDGQPIHHRVSGISTSNALALLTPPPDNAVPGSKWRPWLKLTEYELAVIRKTMKKNVNWVPSAQMITRYLADHERGPENYQIAKAIAESTGVALIDEEPESKDLAALSGRSDEQHGSSSPGVQLETESQQMHRADQSNDTEMADVPLVMPTEAEEKAIADYFTTAHRPRTRRATQDAMPMDELSKKMNDLSRSMKTIFDQPPTPSAVNESGRSSRKRKRAAVKDNNPESPIATEKKQDNKRLKVSSPEVTTARPPKSPVPLESAVRVVSTTKVIPLAPEGISLAAPAATPSAEKTVDTVELGGRSRRSVETPGPLPTAAQSRPRRTPVTHKDVVASVSAEGPSQLEVPRASRSSTRSGGAASIKAASAEPPTSRRERREPRRFSGHDETISTVPAAPPRTSRRKPLPGIVATDEASNDNVSIGKRKSKPKGRGKADAAEKQEEIEEDEPTYCICDDVSYGVMIACENEKCEKEWFHLKCVNLKEVPPRRTKWFCPLCQDKLHIDEKGNAAAVLAGRRK